MFHTFFPLRNLALVSKIISTGIVGNPTVVSHFFPLTNLAIVSKIICTGIVGNPTVVSHFFPLTNLAIVSKIICTGIVGNPTVVLHFVSSHKSSQSFKYYLHWDFWKSNRFVLGLSEIQPFFQSVFPLTNLAIVSRRFSNNIVGNPTVVSNFFSSHKSSHSLNNFSRWGEIVGNPTVVSNFFPLRNQAILSRRFWTGIVGNPTVF